MNKDNVKLAIAPIGWTNDDMPELGSENTFQQIVSEMALAGFTGSEVGSKYPRDPAVLKPMLDIRGIQICNAWFSTFFANGQREKTIDEFVNHMNFLHAMGAKVIGCSEQSGSIQGLDKPILGDAKPCFSDEEWQRVAEGYNTLGRLAAEKGMQVCLHHHMGTGIQTTAEIDKFMSLVDERVFLLFDTGHAWYSEGGEAPDFPLKAKLAADIAPYVERVFSADLACLAQIICNFHLTCGSGSPHADVEAIIRSHRLCCTNPRADALTPTPDGLMPRHPPARSAAGRSD